MIHNKFSPTDETDAHVVAAQALLPALAQASSRIEQARALPSDVLQMLFDADLFRLLAPRSCGGSEVRPDIFFKVVETLAHADASAAWCVSQGGGCAMSAAYLPREAAHQVFGDAAGVIAWGPGAAGKAVKVDGGYRVSGSWNFASGISHARYVGGHCQVLDEARSPLLDAAGQPVVLTLLFPLASAEVSDVWNVIGLRGTGSNAYTANDVFVPSAFAFGRDSDEYRREPGPLYQFKSINMYGIGSAAISLGLARASLEQFISLSKSKVPFTLTQTLRENGVIQAHVAMAEARIKSSRAYLLDVIMEMWETASSGLAFTPNQRMDWRLATTFAMQTSREIVEFFYNAAGTNAIFENQPFERRFRDMHAVSQQGHGSIHNYEVVGQMLLGRTESDQVKFRKAIEIFGLQTK